MTSLWRHIYSDFRRYRATGATRFGTVFFTQGFWASTVYRFSYWTSTRIRFAVIRKPIMYALAFVNKSMEIVTGVCMPHSCEIGEGLYIGHYGGIFLPSRGRLGNHCSVSQGVTIGIAGWGDNRGAPTLGDRVYVGPHAIVVGKITIGDDAVICAGAVVMRSIPPRGVALGNPARVVSYTGSFDYLCYDGMESDPARTAAKEALKASLVPHEPAPNPDALAEKVAP